MADGEVFIDTRIRGIAEVEKDIRKLNTAMSGLDLKMKEFQMLGDTQSSAYRKMQARAEVYRDSLEELNAEYDSFRNNKAVDEQSQSTEKLKNACDRASKSVRKLGDSTKKSHKSFNVGLKTILKYAFGIRSLFVLVNKLRSALVEGFKNMAQFNNGVNPVNKALSSLKSALTQLKNSFATAFAPILTTIEPILTSFINKISEIASAIGMLFASLAGQKTFTKAIAVQEDYAKSLDSTGKSAKKTKQYLSGLDEIKTFQSKDDESGSADPNKMFETVEIESKIAGFADRIREIIQPFRESLANWFSNIDFSPLLTSLGNLRTAIKPIVDGIGKGLLWVLENVLEPIGSFTIEEALPHFFDALSKAVNFCVEVFKQLQPTLEYIWKNVFVPMGQFIGEVFITVIDLIGEAFTKLTEVIRNKSDKIQMILDFLGKAIETVWTVVKTVIQFIVGALRPFIDTIVNVVSHVIDILAGLITFITGVFTGNWKKAWEGIKDVFRGIWNIIVDILQGAINMIIEGINSISLDVPTWVPVIGGKHFGFDLDTVNLPKLATGTVVPRQAHQFMAVLGDNNKETEVVSPLSTMKQAMIEALSEVGGIGGNGQYQFTAQINRRTLFDEFIEEAKMRQLQTGRNPLTV